MIACGDDKQTLNSENKGALYLARRDNSAVSVFITNILYNIRDIVIIKYTVQYRYVKSYVRYSTNTFNKNVHSVFSTAFS